MTKAITILQPWATLIALKAKEYETRSWPTSYRGTLVIHAGKNTEHLDDFIDCISDYHDANRKLPPDSYERFCLQALRDGGFKKFSEIPFGAAICFAELVDCIPTYKIRDKVNPQERAFGGYSDGRYAWKLSDIRVIDPIPIPGAQGLWDWDAAYHKKYPLGQPETKPEVKPAQYVQQTMF